MAFAKSKLATVTVALVLFAGITGCDGFLFFGDSEDVSENNSNCPRETAFVHVEEGTTTMYTIRQCATTDDPDYSEDLGGGCRLDGWDYSGENTYFQIIAGGSTCFAQFDAQLVVQAGLRYVYQGKYTRPLDSDNSTPFASGTYWAMEDGSTDIVEQGTFDFYERESAIP